MRRSMILFIALSLFLSGCGTLEISLETPPPPIAELPLGSVPDETVTGEPGLTLNSSSEEIRRAMLESTTQWKSVWMDGTFVGFDPGATEPPPVLREQVWIDLPTSRFRSVRGFVDGPMYTFKVSDGLTILEIDLQTGQNQSNQMPDLGPEKQFVPTYQPGYVYPQPLWGQLGTTISLLAFPSDMAQSDGTFKPLAEEHIAGRETLVVEWTYETNELPSWRVWLDTQTAVILKMQEFGKEGSATLQAELVVNQVIYDEPFDDALFQEPSAPPQFTDIAGNPLGANEPAPPASSAPDPLREVYFFAADNSYGNENIQLVRVPGSCVAGLTPCPEAKAIPTPFDLKFSLSPLVWSPNGDLAAFPYPTRDDGNRAALFLFDPQAGTWQSLAEFDFINSPYWSPDGEWLAFRAQDASGKEDIYAVRGDGTQLKNLTENEGLPQADHPYVLNGWLNNSVILRGGAAETVYLVRVEDGSVKPLFDIPLAKSDLVPSPDGYFLAYVEVSGPKAVLKLMTPDGNTIRELTAFQNSSIFPVVWSPDGTQIAFAKTTGDGSDGQDIYLINSDGRNLQQVYHSDFASINDLHFSPDGRYFLFQNDDEAGRHIFVLDLSTLEQHKLQIPGIPLDWWWLAPSWR